MHPSHSLFVLPAVLLAAPAAAQDAVPAPVNGISFDEWASANARVAAGRPLPSVLATLGVTETQWKEADAAFGAALKARPPGALIERYGAAFSNPNAGRFAAAADAPKSHAITSFAQFAAIGAEMTAAREAGQDVVKVLHDRFGLSPFDWSQEEKPWIDQLLDAEQHDQARAARLRAEQEAALAEARARYHVGGPKQQP